MKKISILLLPILLITGCINYTELNDLTIVDTLTIDYYNNNYIVECYTIEKENEETKIKKLKSQGKTLNDAFNSIYQKSNKRIYLAHLELLILTNNSINNKLKEIIDFFINQNESRNNFNLAIIPSLIDLSKEKDIEEFIEIVELETSTTKSITLETFAKDMLKNNQSYLPLVIYENELTIKGITLINDYKIYDLLNENETIIYNLINNNINKANIDDININSNTTTIKQNKDKIIINIHSNINKNEEKYKNEISKRINELINKYKNKKFNIFNTNLNYIELSINISVEVENE